MDNGLNWQGERLHNLGTSYACRLATRSIFRQHDPAPMSLFPQQLDNFIRSRTTCMRAAWIPGRESRRRHIEQAPCLGAYLPFAFRRGRRMSVLRAEQTTGGCRAAHAHERTLS
jgi:hypothetical protein